MIGNQKMTPGRRRLSPSLAILSQSAKPCGSSFLLFRSSPHYCVAQLKCTTSSAETEPSSQFANCCMHHHYHHNPLDIQQRSQWNTLTNTNTNICSGCCAQLLLPWPPCRHPGRPPLHQGQSSSTSTSTSSRVSTSKSTSTSTLSVVNHLSLIISLTLQGPLSFLPGQTPRLPRRPSLSLPFLPGLLLLVLLQVPQPCSLVRNYIATHMSPLFKHGV